MRDGMGYAEAGRLGARKAQKKIQQQKQLRIQKYEQNPRRCSNCEEPIPYEKRENKYCGHSCSAHVNNLGVARNYTNGNGAKKKCLQCDEETTNSKYCDINCHKTYEWERRKDKIERTGIAKPVRTAKRYFLEKNGHKCSTCSRSTWNGQSIPIVLDHINGNADDWSLKNLRLLCCNCDAQTPTYKGKNKGNGRHSRRQRYKDGKSY